MKSIAMNRLKMNLKDTSIECMHKKHLKFNFLNSINVEIFGKMCKIAKFV